MNIGQQIRNRRKHLERTLETVAAAAELSVPYLSEIERDKATPPLDTIERIAQALETTPLSLLIGTPGFGAVDLKRFEVDGSTTIPPAGNQTIAELAERICSRATPVFDEWSEETLAAVRKVLFAVYLAGYQRGCLSEHTRIAGG